MKRIGLFLGVLLGLGVLAAPALAQYEGTTTSTTTSTSTTNTTLGTTTTLTGGGGVTTTLVGDSTTTTARPGGNVTESAGAIPDGQSRTVTLCPPFLAGSTSNATLNGNVPLGSKVADASGCISFTISNPPGGAALARPAIAAIGAPRLMLAQSAATVIIDGRSFPALVGGNSITATGIGPDGAPVTATATFTLPAPGTGGAGGTGGTGGSAGGGGGGGLPRTGAMILRWSLAALALLAVGTLLVLADRRRRVAPISNDRTPRV